MPHWGPDWFPSAQVKWYKCPQIDGTMPEKGGKAFQRRGQPAFSRWVLNVWHISSFNIGLAAQCQKKAASAHQARISSTYIAYMYLYNWQGFFLSLKVEKHTPPPRPPHLHPRQQLFCSFGFVARNWRQTFWMFSLRRQPQLANILHPCLSGLWLPTTRCGARA